MIEVRDLKKEYVEYAKANGFQLNPDNKTVERIIDGLFKNEENGDDHKTEAHPIVPF